MTSAATKRAATGVYLLFLKEQIAEDDLIGTMQRYQQNAAAEQIAAYSVVIDPIKVQSPLRVARLLAQHTDERTARYIVVNADRAGAVIAERLAQKLPGCHVELQPTQPEAVTRAKALQGVPDEESPACDYI